MSYQGKVVPFHTRDGRLAGRVGPTYLHDEEAARALLDAGFTRAEGPTGLAIMKEESWLSPDAQGDLLIQDDQWGPSYGLMQIRSSKAMRDPRRLRDVAFNLEQARGLFKVRGWKPWGAFNSLRYRKHLAWAEGVFSQLEGASVPRSVKSLLKLLDEINHLAPSRNKAWDGWIGDSAHAARHSDHNSEPDGTVDARDYTHDPAHGADMSAISADIVANKDRRVSYLIWNRRICSGNNGPAPWVWRAYVGSNPHDHHMHVSVLDAYQDDETPWLEEDILAAVTRKEFDKLAEEVHAIYKAVGDLKDGKYVGDTENVDLPALAATIQAIAAKVGV